MFTDKELSDKYNGMTEAEKQGFTKDQFMREVRKVLDPTRNAKILDGMIESRSRDRVARHRKAEIDRAQRNASIGLR